MGLDCSWEPCDQVKNNGSSDVAIPRIGVGAVDPARLDRAIDQLMTVLEISARPKPEEVFDGTFLPDLKDRQFGR